ncbi:hypothetical protein Goklo_007968 [Gossypium klotzschianum]|uniref:Uncharacterized protein n=1 Tax=Gossypium klotzschianum TaxID=34286 RepID=A0A7J8UZ44_9ROSI|nr:hypothetical protein [Gossypium klotzschianum]
MSTEPASIEGSVTPPTLIDSENSVGETSSQTKGTTGKRKVIPPRQEQLVLPSKGVEGEENIFQPGDLIKKHVICEESPARLQKFKEFVLVEKIECKMLCLDVCTRWNSTYLMLDITQNFEKAFERFE